jgi:phosphate transport system substrate-binding protein
VLCSAEHQRKQITIVGSATLYPFITIAAEYYARSHNSPTPLVESIGTGAGIKLFCGGDGMKSPDIATASRKIKDSERALCDMHKVQNIGEMILGYDGVVIAKAQANQILNLTAEELHRALSKYVIKDDTIVENFYKYWDEINPKLAHIKIEVFGPAFGSGTRDLIADILSSYCNKHEIIIKHYPEVSNRHVFCSLIREDGAYIESSENDNIIISKIKQSSNALGIIRFNYFSSNAHAIDSVQFEGVAPSYHAIRSSRYKLSRPLYLYINQDRYKNVSFLENFIHALQTKEYIGPGGLLSKNGLVYSDVALK